MAATLQVTGTNPSAANEVVGAAALVDEFRRVRNMTTRLVAPLTAEDCALQAMPDASPAKWHLAHTSWFYETFLLTRFDPAHEPLNPEYAYLFNSYYNAVGAQYARPKRGLLSRPSLDDVFDYRRAVDDRLAALLERASRDALAQIAPILIIGLHHEQQHQELILTDIKALFFANPLYPVYQAADDSPRTVTRSRLAWMRIDEGLREIGHAGGAFAFDNESPRHRVWVDAFEIADRTITNGEYLAFMNDAGYERPDVWLADGWNTVNAHQWTSPAYWRRIDGAWHEFTLSGMHPLREDAPVTHLSYYEADAFARWAGGRLPTEAEWEIACDVAQGAAVDPAALDGVLLEDSRYHPAGESCADLSGLRRMIGDTWEWTSSAYGAYPGYRAPTGALGEYNAKFMCNQMVLCGGSCVTPRGHVRPTYRNFFPPVARWQFSGLRMARNP